MITTEHVGAAVLGIALDRAVGEPPARWHPVAGFGTAMGRVEQRLYADTRPAGVAHLAAGVGIGVVLGLIARRVVGTRAATVLATTVCAAGKMLDDEAMRIQRLAVVGDLDAARLQLRSLVGLATDRLDEAGIARAVIESVAENSVDAVTATSIADAVRLRRQSTIALSGLLLICTVFVSGWRGPRRRGCHRRPRAGCR